jgi:AcrR family transcriptional regulator
MKKNQLADRQQLDAETRTRIEQAVLEIFAEREFHRVGLIEIARGANVSLQTLYKYYGSKEALLFSTIDTILGQLANRLIDHLQGIETYRDRLGKVFWLVLDFFEKNPQFAQLILSSVYINTWRKDASYKQPALMQAFIAVLSEGRAKGVLTDEVDEKILLDYILGIMSRVILMWVQRGQREPLAAQSATLFDMLWRAIAKPVTA